MRQRTVSTRQGFTLAELLVVVGVIALLLALIVPPLEHARRQAMRTHCMTRLQQLGIALETAYSEYGFYPLWDDGRDLVRHTWIDVLVQRRMLADYRGGYCPEDARPDPLNAARGRAQGVHYPSGKGMGGVDYSYGIGVPLSAGGWKWQLPPGSTDPRSRRFAQHEMHVARRVLAADGNWTFIYNLAGDATQSGIWNDPAWFDNTVAWRHGGLLANMLFQDGHVGGVSYRAESPEPIYTTRYFLWYSGEPIHVGPESQHEMNFYPNVPPPRYGSHGPDDVFPSDLDPAYYTSQRKWTLIPHK